MAAARSHRSETPGRDDSASPDWMKWIVTTLAWAAAVMTPFLAILHFGLPDWFPGWITEDMTAPVSSKGYWAEAGKTGWTLSVAVIAVLLMGFRGAAGRWLPMAILLAALAIAQAWIWQTAASNYVRLGGLIPFSDASVYTEYANTILQKRQVAFPLQDRPMFSALLSSLLLLFGRNLQIALTMLLVLVGISMSAAARAVRLWFGRTTAVIFLLVVILFYARWIGTTMTEHLGLMLGLAACPFLLSGYMQKARRAWLVGVTLLTLALCARAGAFFVLPALLVVTGRHFCSDGRFAWKPGTQAFALILAAMVLNRFLAFCVFEATHFPRSNVSFTIYGVVFNTQWDAAYFQYGTQHDAVWAAIFERIGEQPSSLVSGVWRAWMTFFVDSAGFRFVGRGYSVALQGLAIVAFLCACWKKAPASGFIVAVCIGVGASIPFAPPWDADRMRVYAATIPLHALVSGVGLSTMLSLIASRFRYEHVATITSESGAAEAGHAAALAGGCGVLVALFVFVLPITRYVFFPSSEPYRRATIIAKRPEQIPAGSFINLVADDDPNPRLPNVPVSLFRNRLQGLAYAFPAEAAAFRSLPAGVSIIGGGFALGLLPTEKLRTAGDKVKMHRVKVAWMLIDADRDLALPFDYSSVPP